MRVFLQTEVGNSSLEAHLPCRWSRFDSPRSWFFLRCTIFRFVCLFVFEIIFSLFGLFPFILTVGPLQLHEVFAINVFLVMFI